MPVTGTTDIQQVKGRFPLADVVTASGLRLRGRGRVLQARCPFHEEREPSFTVYQDTQRFYCFGCGAMGDVLDFVQRREGLNLPEAIETLNGPAPRMARPLPTNREIGERFSYDRDETVLTAATRYYAGVLWRNRSAVTYLVSRGIEVHTARELGLGYATGRGLREFLLGLGFNGKRIDESGLFLGRGRERFSGKVIIPETRGGRVVWLTGRSIGGSQPRFQALPGEKPLLGLGRLGGFDDVFIAEGMFDWLTLVQWGFPCCALLGSHGMERQVHTLARFGRVYAAFDNDMAGHEAVARLAVLLGPRVVPVELPDFVKDVADLAVYPHGRALFLDLLTEATRRSHARPVQKEYNTRPNEGGSDV